MSERKKKRHQPYGRVKKRVAKKKPVPRGLRDELAGKSMQATVSKCELVQAGEVLPGGPRQISGVELRERYNAIARSAYQMADAMLRARQGRS